MKFTNSKKMRSGGYASVLLIAAVSVSNATVASPLTLGTPLIGFDTGVTMYTASTGSFTFSGPPSTWFDPTLGGPPLAFIGAASGSGSEGVTVSIQLDGAGMLSGGVAGDDLVLEGKVTVLSPLPTTYDGILLTGEIASFEAAGSAATTNDTYTLTFNVTGGELQSFYTGGVGVNLTSETSNFAGDFSVDFDGGAKGQIGSQDVVADECTISLEATCLVNLPPESSECQAKIAATTLLYTGAPLTSANVTFMGNYGGNVAYTGVDLTPGTTILAAATEADMTVDARPGDLGSRLTVSINGAEEEIHTSCSVPYVAGQPAPLNDGSPSSNWSIIAFVDKNGTVVDSTPIQPSSECEIPPSGAGCYANGKADTLTFDYSGGGCALSDSEALTAQIKTPVCTGAVDEALLAPQDQVTVSVSSGTVSPSTIVLGDSFTLSGFGSSTTVTLTDAVGNTEVNEFHTSCSAPLEIGDVFGGLTLSLYDGILGGTNVDFIYKITNTGATTVNEILVDDVFDGDVPGSPIASVAPAGEATLIRSVELINSVETPVTASAVSGLAVCDAMGAIIVHETARLDKGSKGSKGSKRGSKKMKKKKKKGSHKHHKRSKGGRKKGSH